MIFSFYLFYFKCITILETRHLKLEGSYPSLCLTERVETPQDKLTCFVYVLRATLVCTSRSSLFTFLENPSTIPHFALLFGSPDIGHNPLNSRIVKLTPNLYFITWERFEKGKYCQLSLNENRLDTAHTSKNMTPGCLLGESFSLHVENAIRDIWLAFSYLDKLVNENLFRAVFSLGTSHYVYNKNTTNIIYNDQT